MEAPINEIQNDDDTKTESSKTENNHDDTTDMLSNIDKASNNRDEKFILEVLKSEDMLFVSRAIEQCSWLITDRQYDHIINPEYLHSQLFPHMTSELRNKLEQNIKCNLKDERRVEAFYIYYYYNMKNPEAAFQWLSNCSRTFIATEVKTNADIIEPSLLKRLVETYNIPLSKTNQYEELKKNWNSTESSKSKIALFRKAYGLLIKEESPSNLEEIWEVLSFFFDNLPHNESRALIGLLIKVHKVPIKVRGNFYMKSLKHLKKLSVSGSMIKNMENYSTQVMEFLDEDFVFEIIENVTQNQQNVEICPSPAIISSFLLSVNEETTQNRRYQKTLAPLLERSFNDTPGRNWINRLLNQLLSDFQKYVFMYDMIFPIKMFTDIRRLLEERLPIEQNYRMLTYWKLVCSHVKILGKHKALMSSMRQKIIVPPRDAYYDQFDWIDSWRELFDAASADFASACLQYLKDDVDKYSSSIYVLFANAMSNFIFTYGIALIRHLLENEELIESYLLVIKLYTPRYCGLEDNATGGYAEICKLLRTHPSAEVRLHYQQEKAVLTKIFR